MSQWDFLGVTCVGSLFIDGLKKETDASKVNRDIIKTSSTRSFFFI